MANDLKHSVSFEDEIDFLQLIKILFDYKKLIISTILIFTIASIIYSLSLKPSFNTSAKLEIGYLEVNNVDRELIESPSDLISNLKILLLKNPDGKFSQVVAMNSLEGKIINLETTSRSAEQNENLLVEIIRYIDERHSNLTLLTNNQKKDGISRQIEMIESELSFIRAKELSKIKDRLTKLTNELPIIDIAIRQLEKIILDDTNNLSLLKENDMLVERAANSPTLEQIIFTYKTQINAFDRDKSSHIQEIKSLNNQLQSLENDTFQSDQLFRLKQKKVALENELQVLMNKNQVNTRLIGNIETDTVKPKTSLIISLGIIIGFFTSIFLVFIINFLKSFREVKA